MCESGCKKLYDPEKTIRRIRKKAEAKMEAVAVELSKKDKKKLNDLLRKVQHTIVEVAYRTVNRAGMKDASFLRLVNFILTMKFAEVLLKRTIDTDAQAAREMCAREKHY